MTGPTSLRQLQYLVAVADRLSFTRAARQCYVTQSTLSAGLKELERALGARLVERNRQTVLMTDVGQEVARRARAILAAARDLADVASNSVQPMSGLLRLGVIPTIAPFLLPACLARLRTQYPQWQLALHEGLTATLLRRLEDGLLDFALIALPFDTGKLLVKPLYGDELWLVGRRGDAEVRRRTVSVTPAIVDRLLLLEEGHCLREHTLVACRAVERHAAVAVEATSLLTLVQMIESGLGVGLVPEMAVRSGLTQAPNLVARPLTRPGPKRTIALVARSSTSRQAELKALSALILGAKRAD